MSLPIYMYNLIDRVTLFTTIRDYFTRLYISIDDELTFSDYKIALLREPRPWFY